MLPIGSTLTNTRCNFHITCIFLEYCFLSHCLRAVIYKFLVVYLVPLTNVLPLSPQHHTIQHLQSINFHPILASFPLHHPSSPIPASAHHSLTFPGLSHHHITSPQDLPASPSPPPISTADPQRAHINRRPGSVIGCTVDHFPWDHRRGRLTGTVQY